MRHLRAVTPAAIERAVIYGDHPVAQSDVARSTSPRTRGNTRSSTRARGFSCLISAERSTHRQPPPLHTRLLEDGPAIIAEEWLILDDQAEIVPPRTQRQEINPRRSTWATRRLTRAR
jgi:hypothetical protein